MIDERGVLYEHTTVRVPFSAMSDAAAVMAGATPSQQYGVAPYYFQRPSQTQSVAAVPQPAHTSALETVIAQQVANGWEFLRIDDIVVKHDLDARAYGSSTAIPTQTQAYYVLAFRRVKRPYGAE